MELINHTADWVRGEVFQGRIMLALGLLVLILGILILNSDNILLRGMIIPIGLILLILWAYGGFQNFGRPKHLIMVTEAHAENPKVALEMEYNKAIKDTSTYKILKIVWPIFMVLSIFFYFVVSNQYYKGLSIGLIGLFLVILILDSVLDYRLKIYLEEINKLILS
jgi:hypothetical protein